MVIDKLTHQTTKVITHRVNIAPTGVWDLNTGRNSTATQIRVTEIWGRHGYRRDYELWGFRIRTDGTLAEVPTEIDLRTPDRLRLEKWGEENV